VSHHLEEVFAVADRVTVLRDGRRITTRATSSLDRRELVSLMTGGIDDLVGEHAARRDGAAVLKCQRLGGRAVHDLDLTVHEGEIVGVAGITGSGREELCELIIGGQPRRGVVAVHGKQVEPMRPDLAVGAGIGLIPANRHEQGLVPGMNVRENLSLTDVRRFWRRLHLQYGEERSDASSWIERLAIRPSNTEAPIDSLSGGNQQKVVVGRWLRLNPPVLLLDEPTQGVDVGAKAEIHRLIKRAAQNGTAILVCSSDEIELTLLCDRVLILRNGRVAGELVRPNISSRAIARESMRVDADESSAKAIA